MLQLHTLRQYILTVTLVLGLTVGLTGVGTAKAWASPIDDPCLQYSNHEYEVCTAYVANSSLAVLVPYYMFAHSQNPWAQTYVSYRLNQRYTDQANSLIRSRVQAWPHESAHVAIPHIMITSVDSDLAHNTATITTAESWSVTAEDGTVLFTESNAPHTITMHRVPSYLLHKWVVADIH